MKWSVSRHSLASERSGTVVIILKVLSFDTCYGLISSPGRNHIPWWCHEMETFSMLLASVRNSHRSASLRPTIWRRTGKFWLIFLQFYVYDLRFKAWGPTTFLTEFQTLLLALCEGNPLVTGGFPSKRPMTLSFDIFFDVYLNKLLNKQLKGWLIKMPWCSFDVYVLLLMDLTIVHVPDIKVLYYIMVPAELL